jgi:hypothetical protein
MNLIIFRKWLPRYYYCLKRAIETNTTVLITENLFTWLNTALTSCLYQAYRLPGFLLACLLRLVLWRNLSGLEVSVKGLLVYSAKL